MNSLQTFLGRGEQGSHPPFLGGGVWTCISWDAVIGVGGVEQIMKEYDFDGAGGTGPLKSWAREV